MPDLPYTTRECVQRDGTRTLVVTGDLDAARRRLAPLDDAAIDVGAAALWEAQEMWHGIMPSARIPFDRLPVQLQESLREKTRRVAVSLVAVETRTTSRGETK